MINVSKKIYTEFFNIDDACHDSADDVLHKPFDKFYDSDNPVYTKVFDTLYFNPCNILEDLTRIIHFQIQREL